MTRKTSTLLLSAVVLVALAALTSCGSSSSSPSGSNGYPTSPPPPAKELNSGDFGAGAAYQHRFFAAGTYQYFCVHHGPMTGSVQVSASATDTLANVSITSSTTSFPAASVKPGGRVVWTNNTGMVHTVTSN